MMQQAIDPRPQKVWMSQETDEYTWYSAYDYGKRLLEQSRLVPAPLPATYAYRSGRGAVNG